MFRCESTRKENAELLSRKTINEGDYTVVGRGEEELA